MRQPRPLGLTLALLAAGVLYGLYPLVEALLYLSVGLRNQNALSPRVVISITVSMGLLLLLIPAWRGRPPMVRPALSGTLLALMVANVGLALYDLNQRSGSIIQDAGTQIAQAQDTCGVPLYVLVTLYCVWYLNRYPSRAFYRNQQRDA